MANENHRSAPALWVLVAEDFKPFRQFVCTTLSTRPNLPIIAVASDGLDAVRMAEELQPELILLDIGLPKLNGIEAARRIRTLSPNSRIIFVSQESDPAIVEEALNLGASGYVTKTKAASDLVAAVNTVLDGGQFVSRGLQYQELLTQGQIVRSN